jgi:uncharacterized protein (TIGR02466 family)
MARAAALDYCWQCTLAGHLATETTMELIEKHMISLFPTPIFMGKLPDITVCDRIEKKILEMERLQQGRPHNFGKLAFLTEDNIHVLPEMKELVDLIMRESGQILDIYKIKRDSHYISNMWANITRSNQRHGMHMHPNCLFSGIIYIKTPPNCGGTTFEDPKMHTRRLEPTYTENNVLNSPSFSAPPEKGRMLIWPSYLSHAVEYSTAKEDEDRIVVAFNIMIRGLIDRVTARLELN